MELLKKIFKDDSVIGLSSLNKLKNKDYIFIPKEIKTTKIQNISTNYLLL